MTEPFFYNSESKINYYMAAVKCSWLSSVHCAGLKKNMSGHLVGQADFPGRQPAFLAHLTTGQSPRNGEFEICSLKY